MSKKEKIIQINSSNDIELKNNLNIVSDKTVYKNDKNVLNIYN